MLNMSDCDSRWLLISIQRCSVITVLKISEPSKSYVKCLLTSQKYSTNQAWLITCKSKNVQLQIHQQINGLILELLKWIRNS